MAKLKVPYTRRSNFFIREGIQVVCLADEKLLQRSRWDFYRRQRPGPRPVHPRSPHLRGLFLGTIHGAKGLEFDHVFILDGDWRIPPSAAAQEEERRLLYMGITRARQTLCLMETLNQPNPFITDLRGV